MSHLEENYMLLNVVVLPCAVATSAEVPLKNCTTLAIRSSDTLFFDNTI